MTDIVGDIDAATDEWVTWDGYTADAATWQADGLPDPDEDASAVWGAMASRVQRVLDAEAEAHERMARISAAFNRAPIGGVTFQYVQPGE